MATEVVDKSGLLASSEWRTWVREHAFLAVIPIGLAATQMASLIGYFMNIFGLPQLNWPAANGAMLIFGGSPGDQWFAGAFIHTIDGFVFTLLFIVLLWRKVPLPNTTMGNLGKGIIYGLFLGLINIVLLVPYAYYQKSGLDPFSFGFEFPLAQPTATTVATVYEDIGWKLPFAIMLWHGTYGFFLGALFNPSKDK